MQHVSNVLLPVYIVAAREVLAEVAAAAFLTPKRRTRDEQSDRDETRDAAQFTIVRRTVAGGRNRRAPG